MQACTYLCTPKCQPSQLNGRGLDRQQLEISYTSYEWLLLAQLKVNLDLDYYGCILSVPCIIYLLLFNCTCKEL
jgi:hypothetical protein